MAIDPTLAVKLKGEVKLIPPFENKTRGVQVKKYMDPEKVISN